MSALRTESVHHGVVRPLVIELEVQAVAPEAGHTQDVRALGAAT